MYIAVINATSQKVFNLWIEQSSIKFTGQSFSGRTGSQLGQQHFILTALLLTKARK